MIYCFSFNLLIQNWETTPCSMPVLPGQDFHPCPQLRLATTWRRGSDLGNPPSLPSFHVAFKSNGIVLICKSLSQRSQQLDGLLAWNDTWKQEATQWFVKRAQFNTVQYIVHHRSIQIYTLDPTTNCSHGCMSVDQLPQNASAATQRLRQKIDAVLTPSHTLIWQGTVQPTNLIQLRNECMFPIISTFIVQTGRKTDERSAVWKESFCKAVWSRTWLKLWPSTSTLYVGTVDLESKHI